ncbi:hypothetical protein Q4503_11080 [Colwellia sp. 6_MG-2023]|uniref:hypothetical protein n=1 Tax=Colwellia sp. 6_MG-2023 TaxID=3062676 RepID=UPI0026E3D8AA|nr:hypothetical protein [Colwellia sp. 6_MG-2023]MDO6488247.1 hypothetical protein [Colwellia sp. 6_MG-2023]
MKKVIAIALAAALVSVTACSSYELGDVSRVYCGSTSPEFRAQIKATMLSKGVEIGLDYCATAGLVDQMIVKKPKE